MVSDLKTICVTFSIYFMLHTTQELNSQFIFFSCFAAAAATAACCFYSFKLKSKNCMWTNSQTGGKKIYILEVSY